MMGVKVDIEDFRFSGLKYVSDSNRGIIVNTKSRRSLCPRMMPAARRMKNMERAFLFRCERATFRQAHHGAQGHKRPTSNTRRHLVHMRRGRSIPISESRM